MPGEAGVESASQYLRRILEANPDFWPFPNEPFKMRFAKGDPTFSPLIIDKI